MKAHYHQRAEWRVIIVYFGLSFLLHFLWEKSQRPLYEEYTSFWETFWECLYATATGDMLFMLTIYLTVAVAHQGLWWIVDRRAYTHLATWILPVVVGALIAVSFELWAVYVVHRWAYEVAMPLIPVIGVGLTPVLQMIVIPLVVILFCRWMVGPSFEETQ